MHFWSIVIGLVLGYFLFSRKYPAIRPKNLTIKTFRVLLDFDASDFVELDKMRSKLGVSWGEMLRYALRTLQWMVKMKKSGNRIASVKRDGDQVQVSEPQFEFLEHVQPTSS